MPNEQQNLRESQKRAAIFVTMLKADTLASVLKELNEHERLQLIQAYQKLSRDAPPDENELTEVAKSFLQNQAGPSSNRFKEALTIAFGPDAAHHYGSSSQWTEIAERIKPPAMADFLRAERANTSAIVLSQLPPVYAAEVLTALPEEQRYDIIDLLASGLSPSDGVVEAVLSALRDNLGSMNLAADTSQGARLAAAMLNQVDLHIADAIVAQIRQRDPSRATAIEDQMFHFEDLVKLDNRTLQMILSEIKPERLALALKGSGAAEQEAVFAALAEQVKAIVVQEMEDIGKVPGREVRAARREIIELAMSMHRDGKIRLRSDTDLVG